MNNDPLQIVFIIVIVILGLGGNVYLSYRTKKTGDKEEDYARRNKLKYYRSMNSGILRDRDFRHIPGDVYSLGMKGNLSLLNVTNGSCNNTNFNFGTILVTAKRRFYYSFFLVTNYNIDIPYFFLRKRIPIFDTICKAFGKKFIEFRDDSVFNSAFVLQGDIEESIKVIFTPQDRKLFYKLYKEGYKIEGTGDALFFVSYNNDKDIKEKVKINDTAVKIVEEISKNRIFGRA